ncbi:MAG TPA: hypothetical protein VMU94_11550 [Streptosporangiaceae bacterium]|nr:hypothetical protein [Streptosporangiaceae bacterium]
MAALHEDGGRAQLDVRSRRVATMWTDENTHVRVSHVYDQGGRDCACGASHLDEGLVELEVHNSDGTVEAAEDQYALAYMTAAEALVLAQGRQRAAQLVLETHEAPADTDRELHRLTAHRSQQLGPEAEQI